MTFLDEWGVNKLLDFDPHPDPRTVNSYVVRISPTFSLGGSTSRA